MNERLLIPNVIPPVIEYIASTTFYNTLSTTSIVLSKPSGTVSGDRLVAMFAVNRDNKPMVTVPGGFSLHKADYTIESVAIYSKVAGSSEPSSYTFTVTNYAYWAASMTTLRNVNSNGGTGVKITSAANRYIATTAPFVAAGAVMMASISGGAFGSFDSGPSPALYMVHNQGLAYHIGTGGIKSLSFHCTQQTTGAAIYAIFKP